MKRRVLQAFVLTLLLSLALAGQTAGMVAYAGDPITEAGPQLANLRVLTPLYQVDPDRVTVPGYALNDTPGAPQLPVYGALITLPTEGEWTLSYELVDSVILPEQVELPAVPVPLNSPRGTQSLLEWMEQSGAVPVVDQPDPAIYGTNAFYPAEPVATGQELRRGGERLLPVRVFPFQYNPVLRELRYHPEVRITINGSQAPGTAGMPAEQLPAPSSGALSAAPGQLRIYTSGRGMVRLTYDDLQTAQVPVDTVDPATFAMSNLGQPIAIRVTGAQDNSFDPGDLVVFYAVPYEGRYEKENLYWFSYGGSPGLRMDSRTASYSGSEPVVTTVTQTTRVEFDRDYRTEYHRPRDADHWFDTALSVSQSGTTVKSVVYDLPLDDYLTSAGDIQLRVLVHGGKAQAVSPDQSMTVRVNSHTVGTYQWDGSVDYEVVTSLPGGWLDGSPNQLTLEAATAQLPGLADYFISPDWVELTYPALADAEGDRMYIQAVAAGSNQVQVTGFSSGDIRVYDVRNLASPVEILSRQSQFTGSSYTLSFWDSDLPDPTYFLSTDGALLSPARIEVDSQDNASLPAPSSWADPAQGYDYIAIVHPALWDVVQPLLDHRSAEGLRVAKINVQDIYDQYNFGLRDPEAIRSFLADAYWQWNLDDSPPLNHPQYVLLVGDGHYDFTGVSGSSQPNLIPPYLIDVDPWIGETASDNRYVSVDGPDDNFADMAIGRLSARTPTELGYAIDKIIDYETVAPAGDWQRETVYVADNCQDPAGNFHLLSDDVRLNWLPGDYSSSTVYYGATAACPGSTSTTDTIAEMNSSVKAAFNDGAVMLQWFGHGSRFRWGNAGIMFANSDVASLNVNDVWPITFHYTCWTGYFMNLAELGTYGNNPQSLGEALVLADRRGSVADLSPAGKHVGSSLLVLNQGITKSIFGDGVNRLGKAVMAGKDHYVANGNEWPDLLDTMIYFGDPALKVRLPQKPLAPVVESRQDGTGITLSWGHVTKDTNGIPVTVTHYEVWRSTVPHFVPGDLGAVLLATIDPAAGAVEDTPVSFTDASSGSGDPSTNHFYIVRSVTAATVVSAVSNRTGEFDFELVAGL
jgi:hypothetical protein